MTDITDHASALEQLQRDQALAARPRREPPQLISDGRVLCIDCEEPIPAPRLASKPNAARCIDCQRLHEKQEQQRHGS